MSQVVVGGTFNVFHKGHAKLLDVAMICAALRHAALVVGVSSIGFAQSTRDVPVRPFRERVKDISEYIESSDLRPEFGPVFYKMIEHKDDMPVMEDDDVLVVSQETAQNAYQILTEKGYLCHVEIINMVCDENGEEIHSTKILREKTERE